MALSHYVLLKLIPLILEFAGFGSVRLALEDGTMFDIVLGLSSSDLVLAFLVVYGCEIDLIGQMIYKFFGEPRAFLAKSPASGVIEGALF